MEGAQYFQEHQFAQTLVFRLLNLVFSDFLFIRIMVLLFLLITGLSLYTIGRHKFYWSRQTAVIFSLCVVANRFFVYHLQHVQFLFIALPILFILVVYQSHFSISEAAFVLIVGLLQFGGPSYVGVLWAVVFSFRIIELILCRQYKAATLVATLCAVSALYWLDTNLGFAKIALAGLHREPWQMNIYSVQLGQIVIPNIELTKQNITNLFGKQATMNGNMFVSLALWFSTVLAVRNRQVVWGLFTLGLFLMLWGAGPRLELIRGFGMTNPVHFFLHDVIQIAKAFRYLPFFFLRWPAHGYF